MPFIAQMTSAVFRTVIYAVALVTGAIASRCSAHAISIHILVTAFTPGAAPISTVLAALTAGYFVGGFIGDRTVSATVGRDRRPCIG
jgi:hypothetical protein